MYEKNLSEIDNVLNVGSNINRLIKPRLDGVLDVVLSTIEVNHEI